MKLKVNKLLGAPLAERFIPTLVPDLDNTSVGKHYEFYNHIRVLNLYINAMPIGIAFFCRKFMIYLILSTNHKYILRIRGE